MPRVHQHLLTRSLFTLLICCAGCGDTAPAQEDVKHEDDGLVRASFGLSRRQGALVASAHMVCSDMDKAQRACKPLTVRGQLEDQGGALGAPGEFVFSFTYNAFYETDHLLLGEHAPGQYMAQWVVPEGADQASMRLRVTLSDHRGAREEVIRFADSLCYEKPAEFCDFSEVKPRP